MLIRDLKTLKQTVKIAKSGADNPNEELGAMLPFVRDAQRFYIEPYLGRDLIKQLESIISLQTSQQKYADLLPEVQRALGPLAYMLATHESSIGFGDAGHTVTRTDTLAPASDEKVRRAQETAEFRGWQNLEYLLDFLEQNIAIYPEWKCSRYFRNPRPKYFINAADFNLFVNINNSRLTFEKITQLIRNIEQTEIADLVPLEINNPFDGTLSNDYKRLITFIRPYIAFRVAALHTSQPTNEQQVKKQLPEYKPVILPLYENIANAGNYYQNQSDYYRSNIIEALYTLFDIDKSSALKFNTQENKIFVDIG